MIAADAVQTTAASQPLLLAHNGASSDNYWYNSVGGNYCSTPNATANQITGDIEIIVKCAFNSITAYMDFVSKSDASVGYSFAILNTRFLTFVCGATPSGTISATSTVALSIALLSTIYLKVTRQVSNGEVKFYTSNDGISYTQLGTTITSTTGNIRLGSQPLEIGQNVSGSNNRLIGKIYRATISNSIGGAPVVDFNPATYNASTSQTTWTSSTGEVWTINTATATSGYKGVLVDRSIVQSDGVDDVMASGTVNINPNITMYCSIRYTGLLIYSTATDGASSLQRHSIAQDLNYFLYNGGIAGITSNGNPKILSLVTVDRVVLGPNKIRINNGSDVTGSSSSPNNITTFKIFNAYTNTAGANAIINTLIQPSSLDSDATKTAMYNLIRSLNNNAF
jgi:hypothetical protein